MELFPIKRPRLGVSFTPQKVSVVRMRRPWVRTPRVCAVGERALPEGLLIPSSTDPNIADVSALAVEIRAARGKPGAMSAAVCLPDGCAEIGLFDFATLPRSVEECRTLLRWRFQQDLSRSVEKARIVFRTFRCRANESASGQLSEPAARVMAIALQEDVVTQYEQACVEAGLWPVSVGIASLQLYDLFCEMMGVEDELFFVSHSGHQFSFLAIKGGIPVFWRTKSVVSPALDFPEELVATIQFYDDRQGAHSAATAERTRSVFALTNESPTLPVGGSGKISPTERALSLEDQAALRVRLILLTANNAPLRWSAACAPESVEIPALAVVKM